MGVERKYIYNRTIFKEQKFLYTIKYCHAVPSDENLNEDTGLVEHFFVLGFDLSHNYSFTHEVQRLVCEYLKLIDYTVETMHEFIDGSVPNISRAFTLGICSLRKKILAIVLLEIFLKHRTPKVYKMQPEDSSRIRPISM